MTVKVESSASGDSGGGPDTLLVSLQPLKPTVAAKKHRTAHNMFPAGLKSRISMLPLFWTS